MENHRLKNTAWLHGFSTIFYEEKNVSLKLALLLYNGKKGNNKETMSWFFIGSRVNNLNHWAFRLTDKPTGEY